MKWITEKEAEEEKEDLVAATDLGAEIVADTAAVEAAVAALAAAV